jgi:hypothetical protein
MGVFNGDLGSYLSLMTLPRAEGREKFNMSKLAGVH